VSARVRLVAGPDGPALALDLVDRERELLSSLLGQLAELLSDGDDDPAVRRLLPDGYRDDAEAAAEFRRYTRSGLVDHKTGAAEAVVEALRGEGRILLSPAEAERWLPTLTDLRLVLAERLGIRREEDQGEGIVADVYEWLGLLQAGLVAVLDELPLDAVREPGS